MNKIHKDIRQPEIYNTDVFEKSLDSMYMKLIYMDADIQVMKKNIIEMKEWLEEEKDMWKFNG